MNHALHYERLIEKAALENSPWTATETLYRHHIVPRSIGGTDHPTNLVYLTAKQHFIAHLLLSSEHPTQIFACELIAQATGYKLKRWQRRRAAYLRAAQLRAKSTLLATGYMHQKLNALHKRYEQQLREIDEKYANTILDVAESYYE